MFRVHTIFFNKLSLRVGKFVKCILTYLYCMKYNEINMSHSDEQKHIFYKKNSFNRFNFGAQSRTTVYG